MKKLKKWIIKKLGGFNFSDLPPDLAQEWLNRQCNVAIDNDITERLKNGF